MKLLLLPGNKYPDLILFFLQYKTNIFIDISGKIVYLSLLPLPRTFNLCSLELMFSIFKVAISSTRSPEQKARINQHLCFKFFSLSKILMKLSFGNIVGILFFILQNGNFFLFNSMSKQIENKNLIEHSAIFHVSAHLLSSR